MPTPGTQVDVRDAAAPRSNPTDTSVGIFVGFAEKGDTAGPHTIRSLVEFDRNFGGRVSYSALRDSVEAFLAEGGSTAIVQRQVGAAPVKATVNVPGSSGTSIVATAKDYGDYGNDLNVVASTSGAGFKLTVQTDNGTILEVSPELANNTAAAAYASDYVVYTAGAGSTTPTTGATVYSLAGGTDDHGAATTSHLQAALDKVDAAYGPGQVMAPDYTTAAAHAILLQHAKDKNRFAMLQAAPGQTVSALVTLAATSRALGSTSEGLARHGMLFAQWATVPGIASGTTRSVPWSVIAAGMMARLDARNGNPNEPAAGQNGISRFATGLSNQFNVEVDRGTLNDAGVNVARVINGSVMTYGYRTLVDPAVSPAWLNAANARLAMEIKARGDAIAARYVFRQIDGQKLIIQEYNTTLSAMLHEMWVEGSLYGPTADDAYRVETGVAVNTDVTIANGELHAVLSVRMSPFAERVYIELVKTPITQGV